MESITREVWNIIKSDAAIQKDLTRSLINTRALARYLLKRYPLSASLDSVISAIRRFERGTKAKETEEKLTNLFTDASIATRNNIACVTLGKEAEKKLPALCTLRGLAQNGAFRIITGSTATKLIADQEQLPSITAQFPETAITDVERGLSELSITLSGKVTKTKGVLARIASEISLADINIEETIICPPEFLIYVKQADVLKTYESVLKLREKR